MLEVQAEYIWGLFVRALGLVFFVNFLSVTPQLRRLIGRDGIEPVYLLLRAVRRDLGFVHRLLRYPTLLWLSDTDAMLVSLGVMGGLASLGIMTGALGGATWILFLVVWVCWLSIQTANTNLFWFPWDNLVAECALLGSLLPGILPLPDLRAELPPEPWVGLIFAWLVFRVMFGMGLAKFRHWDERTRKLTYLYHFLEWQPFPTGFAARMRDLPLWAHKSGLMALWVIEIIVPFLVFSTDGAHRLLAACCFAGLQLVIWASGNFGTFNLLTLAVSIPLLLPLDWPAFGEMWMHEPWILAGLAFYGLMSLFYLLGQTTWTGAVWLYMPKKLGRTGWAMRFAKPWMGALRCLAPFRIWNAYGVFIPRGNVPHQVAVLQMSEDGQQWEDIEPRWLSCRIDRRPPRFAPHHPRVDHFLFYQGHRASDLKLACLMGTNPYYVDPHCFGEKLIQKLLAGDHGAWAMMAVGKPPESRPRYIRHSAWHYHMLGRSERLATGNWWRRELVGVGEPIERQDNGSEIGIRESYDPFIFDRLVMVDSEVLAVVDPRTESIVPINKNPVVMHEPSSVAKSRSVVDAITDPVAGESMGADREDLAASA